MYCAKNYNPYLKMKAQHITNFCQKFSVFTLITKFNF